jgi:PAS domain S-box-containing protein
VKESKNMTLTSLNFRQRIALLRWAFPLFLVFSVVVYQLVVASWVHDRFGENTHYMAEILFYATLGPLLTYWIMTNITQWMDQKEQAEMMAHASEERLATITNASADVILSLDQGGKIESWNRGAVLVLGYEPEEIIGQEFPILMEGQQNAEVELRWLEKKVQQDGYVRGHETICRDIEQRSVNVELTATRLSDEHGDSAGMSVILRDITNRKQREQEINRLNENLNLQVADRTRELNEKVNELAVANRELQKLDQLRSEFVSLVSHQLRAPLTNMSGAVQRIRDGCDVIKPRCIQLLDIIDQQNAHLNRMVQDILDTARIEAGELTIQTEPVSIYPLIQQVVDQVRARSARRTIHLHDKPGLPLVYADRDRITEVITNLLDNADKYSPPKGDIYVEVRANQTEVISSIRDDGPGVSDAELERIFEKFYRTDSSDSQTAYGYGLGLYVCRQLVEAQGGRIWAENYPGGGLMFSFSLPVWQEEYDL